MPTVVDQAHILKKIIEYLQRCKRDLNYTNIFSYGACSGLSLLWLYSCYLTYGKKLTKLQAVDNNAWFWSSIQSLLNNSEHLPAVIDPFINKIVALQEHRELFNTRPCIGLEHKLHDTNHTKFQLQFNKVVPLYNLQATQELLSSLLQEDLLLIEVNALEHTMGLVKAGKKYIFYDPNSPHGELITNDLAVLSEALVRSCDLVDNPAVICCTGYTDKKLTFKSSLFEQTRQQHVATLDNVQLQTLIACAALHNDCELLAQLVSRVDATQRNSAVLNAAAQNNHVEAFKLLLAAGYDPLKLNQNGYNAVLLTIRYASIECLQVLLAQNYLSSNLSYRNLSLLDFAVIFAKEQSASFLLENLAFSARQIEQAHLLATGVEESSLLHLLEAKKAQG